MAASGSNRNRGHRAHRRTPARCPTGPQTSQRPEETAVRAGCSHRQRIGVGDADVGARVIPTIPIPTPTSRKPRRRPADVRAVRNRPFSLTTFTNMRQAKPALNRIKSHDAAPAVKVAVMVAVTGRGGWWRRGTGCPGVFVWVGVGVTVVVGGSRRIDALTTQVSSKVRLTE
jgi:hypothetical protein